MSDASANAIRVALSTGLISENGATLLHAFVAVAQGKLSVVSSDQQSIDGYVASERQRALDEVAAFLVANDLRRTRWSLRVEEGGPMEIISRAVSRDAS